MMYPLVRELATTGAPLPVPVPVPVAVTCRVLGVARQPYYRWIEQPGPEPAVVFDITEHLTGEGKLHLCAIKDVYSNRIVGYSIESRMKSRIAVNALNSAVARRGEVAGCILQTDRGSHFRSRKLVRALDRHDMVGSMGRVGAAGDNTAIESSFSLLRGTS